MSALLAASRFYAQLNRQPEDSSEDDWLDALFARCTEICGGDEEAGKRLARSVIWGCKEETIDG